MEQQVVTQWPCPSPALAEMLRVRECPECDGSGWFSPTPVHADGWKCHPCHGRGRVLGIETVVLPVEDVPEWVTDIVWGDEEPGWFAYHRTPIMDDCIEIKEFICPLGPVGGVVEVQAKKRISPIVDESSYAVRTISRIRNVGVEVKQLQHVDPEQECGVHPQNRAAWNQWWPNHPWSPERYVWVAGVEAA